MGVGREGGTIPVMGAQGEARPVMGAFGGPLRRTDLLPEMSFVCDSY